MNPSDLNAMPPWDWPAGSARILRRVLRDPSANPAERLTAADLAGNLVAMDDEMADALLRILDKAGEPEALRAAAAISLGPVMELASEETGEDGFDDPDAIPVSEEMFRRIEKSLQKLYRDSSAPKLARRRALEASVRFPARWHEAAVREAWASGDRDWVLTAVFAMEYIDGFAAETLEALKSDDLEIHVEAVLAAGAKDLASAWPHIRELLLNERTEKDLRLAAIEAAGNITNDEALEILLELERSEDEDIAAAAEEALSLLEVEEDLAEEVEEEEEDEEEEDEE